MGYLTKSGKYLFSIAFIIFGAQHFIYADFVATLVPRWMSWHLFWAYFVGVVDIPEHADPLYKGLNYGISKV